MTHRKLKNQKKKATTIKAKIIIIKEKIILIDVICSRSEWEITYKKIENIHLNTQPQETSQSKIYFKLRSRKRKSAWKARLIVANRSYIKITPPTTKIKKRRKGKHSNNNIGYNDQTLQYLQVSTYLHFQFHRIIDISFDWCAKNCSNN